jgi:hypothetical protein
MVESIFQNLWSVLAVDDEKINGKTRELQIDHFLRFFFQTCLASLDFGRRLLDVNYGDGEGASVCANSVKIQVLTVARPVKIFEEIFARYNFSKSVWKF